MCGSVTFIGAGPGAPGLLTLDAVDALKAADRVLYADSLVSPEIARFLRPGVPFEGTKDRHLDAIVAEMITAARGGEQVARVHSGDPSLYGAITEQIAPLRAADIPYHIIPGVSSVFAAAAALGIELTVPGVAQTVIMTRPAGRTGVPAGEALRSLAAHGTSLAILLGITRISELVTDLLAGGYPPETPIAALYRVSWPDEGIVRGTLGTIVEQVREAKWTRQAIILVGPAIDPALQDGTHRSHLYDAAYTHRFRRATTVPDPATAPQAFAETPKTDLMIVSLTKGGTALGEHLAPTLDGTLYAPRRFASTGAIPFDGAVSALVRTRWGEHARILLLMPVGIVVRAIAPLLREKATDPGIVALDESGRFAVSITGGHRGGANDLARMVATLTGGEAVVTTASDVQGLPALDLLGQDEGWTIATLQNVTRVTAALVNGERVAVYQEAGSRAWLSQPEAATLQYVPDLAALTDRAIPAAIVITPRSVTTLPAAIREKSIVYHPLCLSIGIGCARGVSEDDIAVAVNDVLVAHGLASAAIQSIASIDLKADEAGLVAYASRIERPLRFFSADELNQIPTPTPSQVVYNAVGTHGVAEPAALLAAGARVLAVSKQICGQVTVAIAVEEWQDV